MSATITNNRPIMPVDARGHVITDAVNIAKRRLDYTGGLVPIYLGWARPGSATSAAVWMIAKVTYDANSNPTQIDYAASQADYTQIWDNRAGLTYG